MRPPSAFQWLIGNPVVSLALMLGALAVIYFWFTGTLSGWFALLALVTGATAAKASERVNAYSAWKREWDGVQGGGSRLRLPSAKTMRLPAALAIWAVFAVWASKGAHGDPLLQGAILLFWLGTGMMVLAMFYRLVRGATPKRGGAVIVGVCLPTIHHSSSVQAAEMAVPAHCQQLMQSKG